MSIRTKFLVTLATVATVTAIGTSKAYALENNKIDAVKGENIISNQNSNKDEKLERKNIVKNKSNDREQVKAIKVKEKPKNDKHEEIKNQKIKQVKKSENNIIEGQVVNISSKLNVREGAGVDTKIIGSLAPNEKVKVDKRYSKPNWYSIYFGAHGGFVADKYVKLGEPIKEEKKEVVKADNHKEIKNDKVKEVNKQEIKKQENNKKVEVKKSKNNIIEGQVVNISSKLNVREGAGADTKIIGSLEPNQKVKVDRRYSKPNWYSIYFGAHGGFVSDKYIKLGEPIKEEKKEVAKADNHKEIKNDKVKEVNKQEVKKEIVKKIVKKQEDNKKVEAKKNENNIIEGQVVNISSKLNVREGAGADTKIIGSLEPNQKVKVDRRYSKSNWYSIYFGAHGGFVSANYIKLSEPIKEEKKEVVKVDNHKEVKNNKEKEVKKEEVKKQENNKEVEAKKSENNIIEGQVVNISSKLNVREGAGADTKIIGSLEPNQKVKVDRRYSKPNWYSIYFGAHGGFVSANYIKLSEPLKEEKKEEIKIDNHKEIKDNNIKQEDKNKDVAKDKEVKEDKNKDAVKDNNVKEDKNKDVQKENQHKEVVKDENAKKDAKDKEQNNFVLGQVANVGSHLNVREKPTTKCKIIGKLYEGNQVSINKAKSKEGWYEISFGNHEAYVSSNYIKIIKQDYLITDGLVKFVASYEGYSATPYRGADYQNRTIGYGHVIMPGEAYSNLTEPEAKNLLKSDLNVTANRVKIVLDNKEIKLKTHQFDSLVSFAYNCGVKGLSDSRLLRDIKNKADLAEIKDAFVAWRHCNGIELEGLRKRRLEEFEMYSTGDYIRDL